jgi:hypothetical protein
MNKYLTQLQHNISMVKEAEDTKKELRDTGVIGAVGVGSNLVSDHIQTRIGLNGVRPPKAAAAPIAERLGGFLKNPASTIGKTVGSAGFKRGLKVGAIGGGISLLGDYAAIKINKALEKKAEDDNKYLEKISKDVQKYNHYTKRPVKDTEVALTNTKVKYLSGAIGRMTPGPVGKHLQSTAMVINHELAGRDLAGIVREETRASATSAAKSTGYGLAGAGMAGLIGAGVGKVVGNRGMAKFVANNGARLASKVINRAYRAGKPIPGMSHTTPGNLLDSIAGHFPKQTKAVLGNKNFGAYAGAATGALGGLVAGGAVGAVKGDYDGRLKSIRNQINDGRLANVINTQKKK